MATLFFHAIYYATPGQQSAGILNIFLRMIREALPAFNIRMLLARKYAIRDEIFKDNGLNFPRK